MTDHTTHFDDEQAMAALIRHVHVDDCTPATTAWYRAAGRALLTLEAERDALRLRVAALEAALLSVQWGGRIGQEGEYRACPSCESIAPDDPDFGGGDHLPGCALNSALTGDTTALRAMLVEAALGGVGDDQNMPLDPRAKREIAEAIADRILGASKEGGE